MCAVNINAPKLLHWVVLILCDRFGINLSYSIKEHYVSLSIEGMPGEVSIISEINSFFSASCVLPCAKWLPASENWKPLQDKTLPAPGSSQLPAPLVLRTETSHVIRYDILGLMAWMLSRAEEIFGSTLDEHGRFPSTASHGYMHGYIDRPIVDEWLYIFEQVIRQQWPQLHLRQHTFKLELSHDVDRPFMYKFLNSRKITRYLVGDLLKRHDFPLMLNRWKLWREVRAGKWEADPYYTFDWLMQQSEKCRCVSTFYFICGRSHPVYDGDYDIAHPSIRRLLRNIHERGHQIGLHPSYGATDDFNLIMREFKRLRTVLDEEGIYQLVIGARMHYLRWKNPETIQALQCAGLAHDASLGYPEMPSFRCGTCHAYPMYDLLKNEILSLKIQPLIFMDGSIFDYSFSHAKLSFSMFEKLEELFKYAQKAKGQFSVLWHNSSLTTAEERNTYLNILDWKC